MHYTSPSLFALVLADPLVRALPSPVPPWVVVRGIADALGVALLFLAARPLVGALGGVLAALLYAASPVAWAAARDPAGPFGPVVVAATLLAATRLVARPTLLRGAVYGVLLGLLVRAITPGLPLAVVVGAATLAIGRASWKVGGTTALGFVLCAGPALFVGWDRLVPDLVTSVDALQMPGWLVLGLGYQPLDGYPPGAILLRELTWPAVLLTWLLGLMGAALAVLGARRGSRILLLAPIWAGVALGLTVAVVDRGASSPVRDAPLGVLDVAMPVMAVPVLALLVSCATIGRIGVVRWAGRAGIILLLVAELATLGLSLRGMEQAAQERSAFAMQPAAGQTEQPPNGPLGEHVDTSASLRDWLALTAAMREVAQRTGTDEILVFEDNPTSAIVRWPVGLLGGEVATRRVPATGVLPLDGELAFLVPDGMPVTGALQRPSSTTVIFTPAGTDTGARILTLRPRPATDWLAMVRTVTDGRYDDGSALVGVAAEPTTAGGLDLTLYWELPAARDGRSIGERARIVIGDTGDAPSADVILPPVTARRGGELVLERITLPDAANLHADGTLLVSLLDAGGRLIRTAAGADSIEVTLGATAP